MSYAISPNLRVLLDIDTQFAPERRDQCVRQVAARCSSSTPNSSSRMIRRPDTQESHALKIQEHSLDRLRVPSASVLPAGDARRAGTHRRRRDRSPIRSTPSGSTPTPRRPACRSTTSRSARAAGIQQYTQGTVDFGASDGPMTADQMNAVQGDVIHIPDGHRRRGDDLESAGAWQHAAQASMAPTIADIYLGKITKWNDSRIAALNPGVKLPNDRHHRGPPLGRLGHELHLHRLPDARCPASGSTKVGFATAVELAGRARRQGERRRDPTGQAGRWHDRLCRTDLCRRRTSCRTPTSRTPPGTFVDAVARDGDQRGGEREVSAEHRFPGFDHQCAGRGRRIRSRRSPGC